MSYPHGASGYTRNVGTPAPAASTAAAVAVRNDGKRGPGIRLARSTVHVPSQPTPAWSTTANSAYMHPQLATGADPFRPAPVARTQAALLLASQMNALAPGGGAPSKLGHANAHAHAQSTALQIAQHHAQQQVNALHEAAAMAREDDGKLGALWTMKQAGGRKPDTGALRRAQAALNRAAKHASFHEQALQTAQHETTHLAATEAIARTRKNAKAVRRTYCRPHFAIVLLRRCPSTTVHSSRLVALLPTCACARDCVYRGVSSARHHRHAPCVQLEAALKRAQKVNSAEALGAALVQAISSADAQYQTLCEALVMTGVHQPSNGMLPSYYVGAGALPAMGQGTHLPLGGATATAAAAAAAYGVQAPNSVAPEESIHSSAAGAEAGRGGCSNDDAVMERVRAERQQREAAEAAEAKASSETFQAKLLALAAKQPGSGDEGSGGVGADAARGVGEGSDASDAISFLAAAESLERAQRAERAERAERMERCVRAQRAQRRRWRLRAGAAACSRRHSHATRHATTAAAGRRLCHSTTIAVKQAADWPARCQSGSCVVDGALL